MARQRRAAFQLTPVGGKSVEFSFGAPLSVEEIVERLFDEARGDEIDREEIQSLARELDAIRLDAAGGDAQAHEALRRLDAAAEAAIAQGGLAAGALMFVGAAFAEANIEPPAVLKAAMRAELEQACVCEPGHRLEAAARAMEAEFGELAAALEHDPFAIHEQFAQLGAAFDGLHRAAFATGLVRSEGPSLREAAIGFLFDRDETCAAATACVLVEEGPKKPVSSATILRLERMRDWVAGRRREGIDAALRALRTDVAAPAGDGAPSGAHFHDIAERAPDVCVATPVDGAGAESLVARARTGKRVAVAGVLIKEGVGVADAWVRCNLTRRQSDEMLACLEGGVAHTPVSLQYWEKRLSDALALNLAHAPPPFGLVQVVEALGISFLRPARIEASALADGLLSALPEERTSEEAQAAAARASWTWDERIGVVETWFEAGEEIDALLAPLKGRKAREEAVHNRLLERREIWARRLSLSAAVLKEAQAGMLIADWIDMALMARELACEDHPRGGAPVLMQIAARTVDVFEAQEKPKRRRARA